MKNIFLKIGVLLFIAIFLTPLLFAYNEFELVKIVFFEFLISLIVVLYTVYIFFGGNNVFNSIKNKIAFIFSKKSQVIGLLFSFLLLYFFINTFFAINTVSSFWGSHFRQFGLLSVFFYFLFGTIIFLYFERYSQIKNIVTTILFSSFFIVFYGLIQFSSFDLIKWKETTRVFSTLGQPNFLGHFLLFVIPITVWSIFFLVKKKILRILISILLIMQLACLFLTYSRSAYIALSVGIFLSLFFIAYVLKKKKIFFYTLMSVGILFLIILGLNVLKFDNSKHYNNYFVNRIISIIDFNSWKSGSMEIRIKYWEAVEKEFKNTNWQRRLLGYGMDNTNIVLGKYYKKNWGIYEALGSFPDRAHNFILDIWLNFGLLGLFIISLIWLSFLQLLWKFFKNNTLTDKYYLVFAMSLSLLMHFIHNLLQFSSVSDFIYLSLYIGLILNIIYYSQNDSLDKSELSTQFNLPRIFRLIIIALLFWLVLFLNYFNINFLRSIKYIVKAERSANFNCLYAMNNINKAMHLAPFQGYYKGLYVWQGINCYPRAEDFKTKKQIQDNVLLVIKDIDLNNLSYFTKLDIATAYGLFSKDSNSIFYNKAKFLYKDLIKEYPDFYMTYERLALFNMHFGNKKLAKQNLEKALKLLPDIHNTALNKQHKNLILHEINYINSILVRIK